MNESKLKQNQKDSWCQSFVTVKYLIKRSKLHSPAVFRMHFVVSLSCFFCDFWIHVIFSNLPIFHMYGCVSREKGADFGLPFFSFSCQNFCYSFLALIKLCKLFYICFAHAVSKFSEAYSSQSWSIGQN